MKKIGKLNYKLFVPILNFYPKLLYAILIKFKYNHNIIKIYLKL